MKKDLFKGNVRREYISYIWISIIVIAIVFFGSGGITLYASIKLVPEPVIYGIIVGTLFCLLGIMFSFGTVFVIRKYPKYPKLRRFLINSDAYFVHSTSKEFHGHWRGRHAFDRVMMLGEQNQGFEDIKYPKKYRIYFALTMIGIALIFVYIAITLKVLENIELLPQAFQNEHIIFSVFVIVEIVNVILCFIFAFKVKKIRKETEEEYENLRWRWRSTLYTALSDISVRKSSKKRKFWYEIAQIEEIEALVSAASKNAVLRFNRNSNRIVSFTVGDKFAERIIFEGFFI